MSYNKQENLQLIMGITALTAGKTIYVKIYITTDEMYKSII